MGFQLSKLRAIYRPLRNYNVEERAFKRISQEKPAQAPKYSQKEQANYQELLKKVQHDPEMLEKKNIDPDLLKQLNKVYIKSTGDNPTIERKLPEDRSQHDDFIYGFPEPTNIPRGKYSLKQALDFLTKHKENPEVYTPKKIAQLYNLDEKLVETILKNFFTLNVAFPTKDKSNKPLYSLVTGETISTAFSMANDRRREYAQKKKKQD